MSKMNWIHDFQGDDWTCWPWRFWMLALTCTSPHLTPCDFFLWGFVKQQVYRPPLPPIMKDLRFCVTETIVLVDGPILQRIWLEIEYRINVCRVTQGARIEHLRFTYSYGPNVSLSISCFPVDQFLEFLFLLIPISCFSILLIAE